CRQLVLPWPYSLIRGYPVCLFQTDYTLSNLAQCRLAQGSKAFNLCPVGDGDGIAALKDHSGDGRGYPEHLVDTRTTLIAICAIFATHGVEQCQPVDGDPGFGKALLLENGLGNIHMGCLALGAQPPGQTLGDDQAYRGGYVE